MTGNARDSKSGPGATQGDPTSDGFAVAVTAAEYHDDEIAGTPSLSKSIIHTLLTHSPAHAWTAHPKLNPNFQRKEEAKFDVGTAVHELFLEGVDRLEMLNFADFKTKAAKEARDIARADNRIPILIKHVDDVLGCVNAIRPQLDRHEVAPPMFEDGRPEQTYVWEDRGVLCRARFDWLRDDLAAVDDLKTASRSADPDQWCRQTMYSIGADIQQAFYLRGIEALTGQRPDFRFCVVETTPPYGLSVVSAGPAAIELANRKIDWALDLWRRCLATNQWPTYGARVHYADLPPWLEAAWLERELREAA